MLQHVYNERIDSRNPKMIALKLEHAIERLNHTGHRVDCYNLNPITRNTILLTIVYHEEYNDVLYVCDKKQCADCNPQFCNHTLDIVHAKNFIKLGPTNSYIEIEKE